MATPQAVMKKCCRCGTLYQRSSRIRGICQACYTRSVNERMRMFNMGRLGNAGIRQDPRIRFTRAARK